MKHLLTICCSVLLAAPALADPPDHAPAWGYRNKEKDKDKGPRRFHGYTGVEWEQDYGVAGGRCDTDKVLTVVGAVGGAVIGNRTASAGNRTIATIAGAIIGGLIGNQAGDAIDDGDRACAGHGLEVGTVGHAITWTNPRTHIAYRMEPLRDLPGGCREFRYRAGAGAGVKSAVMVACRKPNATWEVRP
jgi:surface antigen